MMIRKPEEYKVIFSESKLSGYDAILIIARDIFMHTGAMNFPGRWEEYLESLGKEKRESLGDFTYFYYHTARPWESEDGSHTVRDETRIVAITSIMEKLMSEEDHLNFFDWYKQKYGKNNTIDDLESLKKEYLSDFGVHRKFKEYMNSYIVDSNRNELLEGIEIFDKDENDFRSLEDIDEAAKVLYTMRSNFVHNAKMATFSSPSSMYPLVDKVGSSTYRFMMDIEYYMMIFERSFVKYWIEQGNK